ncbi:hypothetical protein L083_4478 [Actinoplanes sp. N902-109]|nr:hypothetical protein L083_4478 [Actinoplanes sp. N902-109]
MVTHPIGRLPADLLSCVKRRCEFFPRGIRSGVLLFPDM